MPRTTLRLMSWRLTGRIIRVHYVDDVLEHGTALFRLACQHDLEGIVAKQAESPYAMMGRKSPCPPGARLKTQIYSQREDRGEWFEKAKVRLTDPIGKKHPACQHAKPGVRLTTMQNAGLMESRMSLRRGGINVEEQAR
jgi:hypothetical protein